MASSLDFHARPSQLTNDQSRSPLDDVARSARETPWGRSRAPPCSYYWCDASKLEHLTGMSRRVLVTGGAGFIGSHVVDARLAEGAQTTVIDDLSSGDARRVPAGADLCRVDIVDRHASRRGGGQGRTGSHIPPRGSVQRDCLRGRPRSRLCRERRNPDQLEAADRYRAPVVFTSTGGAPYGNDTPTPTLEDELATGPCSFAPALSRRGASSVHEFLAAQSAGDRNCTIMRCLTSGGSKRTVDAAPEVSAWPQGKTNRVAFDATSLDCET